MSSEPTLEQIADGEFGGIDLGRRFAREILDQQNEHDNLASNMAASLAEIEERLGEEHPRSYSERCSNTSQMACELQDDVRGIFERLDGLHSIQDADRREIDRWGDRVRACEAAVSVWLKHSESLFARITALEQQSRGYAEDGALAAGRGAGPRTIAQQAHALAAMAEDDYWQGRAEKAEAQRDTARAALRKYGKHWPNCAGVRDAPHNYPWCICGLREALAGGEANEGSGE